MQNLPQTETERPRVLVVDDDSAVSKALERSIRHLGYDVMVAGGGEEGFQQALRGEPAVVLADVHMPGMDGHALLRRLMGSGLQASVILMSGQGQLDDAIGAFREGAIDYLKKPWTLQDLSMALERAMGLSRALRALTAMPRRETGPLRASEVVTAVEQTSPPLDAAAFVEELAHRAAVSSSEAPGSALSPIGPAPRSLEVTMSRAAGVVDVTTELSRAVATQQKLGAALLQGLARVSAVPNGGEPPVAPAELFDRKSSGRDAYEGFSETLAALALHDAFPMGVGALQTLNDRIWRFSLARALAMREIAEVIDIDAPRDRHQWFLSGLLMDVGASWLLGQISAEMERRDSGVANSASMNAAIATHHSAIGAAVLRRWNAPALWIALAGGKETDPSVLPQHVTCAAILGGALAGRLCGFSDPTGDGELRGDGLARCAYTLAVGDTALRHLTKTLTETTDLIWTACA